VSSVVSHLFRLLITRVGLLLVSGDTRDAEILALRHQILVLQRQIDRPRFTRADRTGLAVLSRAFDRRRLNKIWGSRTWCTKSGSGPHFGRGEGAAGCIVWAIDPVSASRFDQLVADALDALPDELAQLMENVAVVTADRHPTEDILGLYEGIPLRAVRLRGVSDARRDLGLPAATV